MKAKVEESIKIEKQKVCNGFIHKHRTCYERWKHMNEVLKLVLYGFTALCVTLSLYLGFVVKEGPQPVHEVRQANAAFSLK